jgi:hypothetical protein
MSSYRAAPSRRARQCRRALVACSGAPDRGKDACLGIGCGRLRVSWVRRAGDRAIPHSVLTVLPLWARPPARFRAARASSREMRVIRGPRGGDVAPDSVIVTARMCSLPSVPGEWRVARAGLRSPVCRPLATTLDRGATGGRSNP